MVWRGMVWCGLVWHGIAGVVWFDLVLYIQAQLKLADTIKRLRVRMRMIVMVKSPEVITCPQKDIEEEKEIDKRVGAHPHERKEQIVFLVFVTLLIAIVIIPLLC